MPAKDLQAFAAEAKKYGVLYCALKEKGMGVDGTIDVMVYKEDAAKINRIVERLSLATVEKTEIKGGRATKENPTKAEQGEKSRSGHISKHKEKIGEDTPEVSRRSVRKDLEELRRIRNGELAVDEKGTAQPPENIKKGRVR